MLRQFTSVVALCLFVTSSQAALLGRVPVTPGGTDYQAYYDTDLKITWLADANLAGTSGYEPGGTGQMNWMLAQAWVASLNTAHYLRAGNWRLPTTLQPDASCGTQNGGDSEGYSCTGSEMGHLFYTELGGAAGQSLAAVHNANYNLFRNVQAYAYWSGTPYAPASNYAWYFYVYDGSQSHLSKGYDFHAWAVSPGDISAPYTDSDGDGVMDDLDNCTNVDNADQLDTDADGYGNICDADLNNSGLTTAADFNILRNCLNQSSTSSPYCADADMNGSGLVTSTDFNLMRGRLNTASGPSGLHP